MSVEETLKHRFTGLPSDQNAVDASCCKRCQEHGSLEEMEFDENERVYATVAWKKNLRGEASWELIGLFHQDHGDVADLPEDPRRPCAVLEVTLEPSNALPRFGQIDGAAFTLGQVDVLDTAGVVARKTVAAD